jgi:hypothetical protein
MASLSSLFSSITTANTSPFSGTALQPFISALLPGSTGGSAIVSPVGTSAPSTSLANGGTQAINALVNTYNATVQVGLSSTPTTTNLNILAYTPEVGTDGAGNALHVTAALGPDVQLGISDNTATSGTAGANIVNIPIDLLSGQATGASALISSAINSVLGAAEPMLGSSTSNLGTYTIGGGAGSVNVGSGTNIVIQGLTSPHFLGDLLSGH